MLPVGLQAKIWGTLGVACVLLQVCSAQQTYTVSTVAGGGYTTPDNGGPAAKASLYEPYGIVEDANGNIYFVETGRAVIRKVTPKGILSTVAGQYGGGGFSGDGGRAINAELNGPYGLAIDARGNLYVADYTNRRIRKISTAGIITTVAGGGNPPCCGHIGDGGPATAAVLGEPIGVAVDRAGNLYIADAAYRVRKVDTKGIITTIAGGGHGPYGGGDGGPATQVVLVPSAIAVDFASNVYIVDHESNRIRKISNKGIISTVAGTGINGYSGDGGPAVNAEFFDPTGVAVDAFGDIYIADQGNRVVRMVNVNGIITTIAGGGSNSVYDGEAATNVWLSYPQNIAVGAGGKLYFTEHRVYCLTPNRVASATSIPEPTFHGLLSGLRIRNE